MSRLEEFKLEDGVSEHKHRERLKVGKKYSKPGKISIGYVNNFLSYYNIPEEIKKELKVKFIDNNKDGSVSGNKYFCVNKIKKELKKRGYPTKLTVKKYRDKAAKRYKKLSDSEN